MGLSGMLLFDGLVILISWLLSKRPSLSILSHILILGLLPLASIWFMAITIKNNHLDFYGYIAVILVTGISFLSVWILMALNGKDQKVDISMSIVFGFVALMTMAALAMTEVLPNEVLEAFLKPLILKGNTYDIWSRPPYQLAHFLIMAASFPYFASFIISKTAIKLKRAGYLTTVLPPKDWVNSYGNMKKEDANENI